MNGVYILVVQTTPHINLKIVLLNAENLFLMSDLPIAAEQLNLPESEWKKISTSLYPNKNLWKLRGLARAIREENPDLILLCEIGGEESLKNFALHFLDDQYSPALVEGNSDRNIDIGFLVRKNLGFYFDLVSNKNFVLDLVYSREKARLKGPQKFSRDAAELSLFLHESSQPFLTILHTHLKSHLDPDGIDPDGYERRSSEMRALVDLYLRLRDKYGHTPLIVSGDLNGNASRKKTDPEFKVIYEKTDLEDVCELAAIPEERRVSFIQLPRHAARQLDYCFLSKVAQSHLDVADVHFHQFKNHLGLPLDPPRTIEDRDRLPSDHYPLVFTLRDLPLSHL